MIRTLSLRLLPGTTAKAITALAPFLFVSCANTQKEDEQSTTPAVEEPSKPAEPAAPADPTAGWRLPSGDTKLPTDSQLADGAESSIGSGSPQDTTDSSAPSTSVKPPANTPEDQLDSE